MKRTKLTKYNEKTEKCMHCGKLVKYWAYKELDAENNKANKEFADKYKGHPILGKYKERSWFWSNHKCLALNDIDDFNTMVSGVKE